MTGGGAQALECRLPLLQLWAVPALAGVDEQSTAENPFRS